VAEWQTRRT